MLKTSAPYTVVTALVTYSHSKQASLPPQTARYTKPRWSSGRPSYIYSSLAYTDMGAVVDGIEA